MASKYVFILIILDVGGEYATNPVYLDRWEPLAYGVLCAKI